MWRKSRRCSTSPPPAFLALAAAGAALPPAGKAASSAAPELARKILSDGAYQKDWPGSPGDLPWRFHLSLGRLGEAALLVLLIACALLAIRWLWGEFGGRAGDRGLLSLARGPGDDGPSLSSLDLGGVDRLADEGRYEEAVHALLLVAIRCLAEILPAPPGPSRTSRELLDSLPLGAHRREAFGDLVREVELSLFGGRPVGPDQYARCRGSFDLLIAGAAP
jgi:hypothetical protein